MEYLLFITFWLFLRFIWSTTESALEPGLSTIDQSLCARAAAIALAEIQYPTPPKTSKDVREKVSLSQVVSIPLSFHSLLEMPTSEVKVGKGSNHPSKPPQKKDPEIAMRQYFDDSDKKFVQYLYYSTY